MGQDFGREKLAVLRGGVKWVVFHPAALGTSPVPRGDTNMDSAMFMPFAEDPFPAGSF